MYFMMQKNAFWHKRLLAMIIAISYYKLHGQRFYWLPAHQVNFYDSFLQDRQKVSKWYATCTKLSIVQVL